MKQMKWISTRWGLLFLAMGFGAIVPVKGQLAELDFVYGGVADAEKILQAYLEPYANILGSDVNAGWYNTARPHQLGGLDVTATVSWAKAPSSLLTYDITTLGLYGDMVPGASTLAPTVAGEMDERPILTYSETVDFGDGNSQDIEVAQFTLPNGAGVDFFPLPMVQLTVGLPFGTDVSGRFIPMIQVGDFGEIGLWGVGGKHSLSQWVPVIKELGFLDIAVQGGYTKVSTLVNLDVEPLDVQDPNPPVSNWDNQYLQQKVAGWTLNLISSQTFSVLTVYEGIGYANSLVNLALLGDYPIHTVNITDYEQMTTETTYIIEEDPITLEYENLSKLRLNVGVRIKLGVFTVHYDFTHTLYVTHSVGIGVSFR